MHSNTNTPTPANTESKMDTSKKDKKDTKKALVRVLQIMETTDEKTPMNSAAINAILEREYEMQKMDRKTISDNMTTLMECGYPIRQASDKRKGWYMADHRFADWEIKLMMDAVQQARCVSANEAGQIRKKLLGLTSKRGRSRFAHLMDVQSGNILVDYQTGIFLEYLLEALYTKKKIEFQYTEIDKNLNKVLRKNGEKYLLNIYAIYWAENNYYLIGAHDHHDEPTQYRLDRVVGLRITDENAAPAEERIGSNPETTIRNYIEKSVNHYSGEIVRLKVEYTPSRETNAILYDFAGGEAKVRESAEGKCVATFRKMYSKTLVGWFMQYGDKFKVLEPESVRDEVKRRVREMGEAYGEMNP